jgi:hypothetical protein
VSLAGGILVGMTTVTSNPVERCGPGIRAALAARAADEADVFEAELRRALARAGEDLDVTRVEAVLARWYPRAVTAANALTTAEREQIDRARGGDLTGLRVRHADGTWASL